MLISGPGCRRSTGPLGTGGSKFKIRKSGYVCPGYPGSSRPLDIRPKRPMDKLALPGRYGSHVSGTVVTHVEAPVAWGPRIIDTADTVVGYAPGMNKFCMQTDSLLTSHLVIMNRSQVTSLTSELAPYSPNFHSTSTGGLRAST
ncbi:hypothetical protein TNCV_1222921 [Trichonephila clavipes]|nr:hypothetical protein TNCV_1222921 [Trichonephila clavipes]